MSTIRTVAKNSAIVMVGQIISTILSIATSILLVRYLGAENFGKYSFVYAYLSMFQIFGFSALDSILLREISKDGTKTEELINNGIVLKIIISLVGIIIMNMVLLFLSEKPDTKFLIALASICFLFSSGTLFEVIFKSKFKMGYPVGILIAGKILSACGMIVLIILKTPLVFFILLNLVVGIMIYPSIFNIMFTVIFVKKYISFNFRLNFDIWKMLFRESWPLLLSGVFGSIYNRIDQVFIHQMVGAKQLGYYAAGMKILEPLNMIPMALMASITPLLARCFVESKEKFEKLYRLTFKYLLVFIIPIASGTAILSAPIVKLLFGDQFLPTIPILKIIVWLPVFTYLAVACGEVYIVVGLQKITPIFTGLHVSVNLFLNIILIPRYGALGAGIACIVPNIVGLIFGYFVYIKQIRLYIKAMINAAVKPVIASFIMAVVLYVFPMSLVSAIMLGSITYFVVIFLTKGLDIEDFKYFKEIFSKSKIS